MMNKLLNFLPLPNNWDRYLILSVSMFLLTSCMTPRISNEQQTNIPVEQLIPTNRFLIASGDELTIKFHYNEELNDDHILVLPDGSISLQLIGDLSVEGKTMQELRKLLINEYKEHIAFPQITLQAKSIRKRDIYIGGDVINPGRYEYTKRINPIQAVIMAGGFSKTAELSNILILRKSNTSQLMLNYYIYNMKENFRNLANFPDFTLQESDIIFVSKSAIGNVKQFVELYVTSFFPSWFNVFVNYEIDKDDI